jgi:hypothetical protein
MIQVSKELFIGDDDSYDYGIRKYDNWAVIHACKERWHREFVGYKTRGCPKDSDEFYCAIRDRELALNMVDVDNPEWFNKDMIKIAMGFALKYSEAYSLLIHCNRGESRSPSLGLLYLAITGEIPGDTFHSAELEFLKRYKFYNPKKGIRQHLIKNWDEYLIK